MEKSYKTKQRANIIKYLINNKSKHITAEMILTYFKDIGEPIGKSTIYRYLDSLVADNKVRKYVASESGSAACFQYIDDAHECKEHYHMKCTKCGNLIHLNCDEIEELSKHIFREHKFKLDVCKTILYGICQNCQKE